MDKKDMKKSICNSQLILSNKKSINGENNKNIFDTFRNKLTYNKKALNKINNQIDDIYLTKVLKNSQVRLKTKKQSFAQTLLKNKGFRDKLISKKGKIIKNRQIRSKVKNRSIRVSTKNKIMAETGSNPSISNLPEGSSVYANIINQNKVLKSSSGVGARLQKSKENKNKLKCFN